VVKPDPRDREVRQVLRVLLERLDRKASVGPLGLRDLLVTRAKLDLLVFRDLLDLLAKRARRAQWGLLDLQVQRASKGLLDLPARGASRDRRGLLDLQVKRADREPLEPKAKRGRRVRPDQRDRQGLKGRQGQRDLRDLRDRLDLQALLPPIRRQLRSSGATGFRGELGGCVGGVRGELGSWATMDREDEQVGQTVASRILKRSMVLFRHHTSVSLEEPFWQALREIARVRRITTSALLNSIASKRGESNLSSAVRVFVLAHFRGECQKEAKT
jgi:predicted DNA-binding ribbon-helix-helix protein